MASKRSWIQEFRNVERNQHTFKLDRNMDDVYDYYVSKYGRVINRKRFKSLCEAFNIRVNDAIVTKSLEFKYPFGMGTLRVKTTKHKISITEDGKIDTVKMAIDWPNSRKMWKEQWPDLTMAEIADIPDKKLLVYTNEHSNGYIMRWYWDKRLSSVKNQMAYIFKPVKGVQDSNYYNGDNVFYYGRRGLSHWIKNDERTNEYYE